ncbi:MAG TPA: DUF362 domain-containing protein [Polyangiaceae bacterium]|nr:DUF362 domain-containing protein [Polyangiaceae bacterium]
MPKRSRSGEISRRELGRAAALVAAAAAPVLGEREAHAARSVEALTAKAPAGFSPLAIPGKISKVSSKGDFASFMQPNQLWPKAEVAKRLLERAMTDFTGAPNLVEAMKKFIHPEDVVAIKVNGIAGQTGYTMAVNFELILPVVEAVMGVGVPANKITVYEQFPNFLAGTRVNVREWKLPKDVKTGTHNNQDHSMPEIKVHQGIGTKYCRIFTEATAVIDMTQIKDHSICGYTGTLKNITHGNINNPHKHHAGFANPQIALLYNHPIVRSRVRLHITDAFKITYDQGPLDKNPKTRIPHGSVYVATDAVAMDTMGWKIIDDERKARGLKSLKDAGREPAYIRTAADLKIGVHDLSAIRMQSTEI